MASKSVYEKVTYQGKTLDQRTLDALMWVDERFAKQTGKHVELAQGSYNAGGVSASAGTHDGGGVIDCRTVPLTTKERKLLVRLLRRCGFAAWYRKPVPGLWGPHIHACLLGPRAGSYHRTMSSGARQQCDAYLAGRDGLKGNRVDSTWRPKQQARWNSKKRRPAVR